MKKISMSIILMMSLLFISAVDINIRKTGDGVKISGNIINEDLKPVSIEGEEYLQIKIPGMGISGRNGEAELPVYTRLVNLPDHGNYALEELSFDFDEVLLQQKVVPIGWEDKERSDLVFYETDSWFPRRIVDVSRPNIMRGNRFSQISIAAVQYNPVQNKVRILKNIDADFKMDFLKTDNPLLNSRNYSSSSFTQIADENIFDYEKPRSNEKGLYLFITPDNSLVIEEVQELQRWKEKLGYKTKLATLSETGSNKVQIKQYILNAYENWEIPPEFVVLVGDTSGPFVVPSHHIDGYLYPWAVTDHYYAMLEGDDYFPDVLVGRLSIQSSLEIQTIRSKIINYESDPYPGNWIKKALMTCYSGYEFTSPKETKSLIREKLLDFTYTVVDTFYAPEQSGQQQLINMINGGYTFINYRGFGSYGYWSGYWEHLFDTYSIGSLGNGFKLPMITSIVCGGGDFDADETSTCFGEEWVSAGIPNNPQGAIGFIGPSERDTKTQFNNANDIGIYQGIVNEELYKCGEMLLRGKMELYNNYPTCHDMDGYNDALDSDQFYFYVYNLLGDPGLSVWTDTPKDVALVFENEISYGANYLLVGIDDPEVDKSGFTIAITNSDSLIVSGITDETGSINLSFYPTPGEYSVTASKYGYIPKTENLSVVSNDIISLFDHTFLEDPVAGHSVNLELFVKNMSGSDVENVSITLLSEDSFFEFPDDNHIFENIPAGENASHIFEIWINDFWDNTDIKDLAVIIESGFGEKSFLVPVEIMSPEIIVSDLLVPDFDNELIQNESAEIYLEFQNIGALETGDFDVHLTSLNDKTEVVTSDLGISNIAAGSTGMNIDPFIIDVNEVISGEMARFRIDVFADGNLVYEFFYTHPVGSISENSPTFSDYGYVAIESDDEGYFDAPEYDWIEIDPQNGGNGTLITGTYYTADGYTSNIDIPNNFNFQYFGKFYDQISVSSNGYMSLGYSRRVFHRNRTIPSGIGPNSMIAPFWDFIKNGDIYYYFDESEHIFIVEWSDFRSDFNQYYHETFEVILYDSDYYPTPTGDGKILFQYEEVNNIDQNDNYATVGIENKSQDNGVLLSFCNIYPQTVHNLSDNSAILFTSIVNSTEPFLSVEPSEINFSVSENSTTSAHLYLTNNGSVGSSIIYEIEIVEQRSENQNTEPGNEPEKSTDRDNSRPVEWLIISSETGSVEGEQIADIILTADSQDLLLGDYYAELAITTENDQSFTIPVHLEVAETGVETEEITGNHVLNFPNPFKSSTTISFSITNNTENTDLSIYNIKGQKIKEFEISKLKSRLHNIVWNGTDANNKLVSSGLYFFKLRSGKIDLTRKILLVR